MIVGRALSLLFPATADHADQDLAVAPARLDNARLFAEVARRVEFPFDALPAEDTSKALILLWKEASFWALAACDRGESLPEDLGAALAAAPRELVTRIAGGEHGLADVERALSLQARAVQPAENGEQQRHALGVLSAFTTKLISKLEAPARKRRRRLLRRWLTIVALAGSVVSLAGAAIWWLRRPPDRAASAHMTTSSEQTKCRSAADCGNALFHTKHEKHPWVMYDLGAPYRLQGIEVENRSDCCAERAVPLVVETSRDGKNWKERVRTERAFSTWSASLDTTARYVRLRVDGTSYLHLGRVAIR